MSTPRIPEKQIIIVDDEPEILMAVDTDTPYVRDESC